MKKIFTYSCFALLAVIAFAEGSHAWDYNFSRIVTDRRDAPSYSSFPNQAGWLADHNSCGVGEERVANCPDCWNGDSREPRRYQNRMYRPLGHSCFKYSCYYQAFSYVKDAPTPIQPLTYDLDAIKMAISGDGVTTERTNPRSGITVEKLDAKINVGGYPWGGYTEWVRPYTIDVGAGTSAMQGLLWAWRSISYKWKGVWTQKSEYEDDNSVAQLREQLPSGLNSKHIILISDGQDTDGIGNYDFTNEIQRRYDETRWKPMRDLNQSSRVNSRGFFEHEGDLGFVFSENLYNQINNIYEVEVPFDTCDAHVSQDSIPYAKGEGISQNFGGAIDQEGYEEVCRAIEQQDIKVHSILYDYADNDRLERCSEITGGVVMKNVAPQDLEDALNQVFISIVRGNIRLTE